MLKVTPFNFEPTFTNFVMNIMPLEDTLTMQFLISYNHDGYTKAV